MVYGALVFVILTTVLLTHFENQPMVFLATEVALVILALFGYRLISDLFQPLELLADTTRRLGEQEFTTRLSKLGQPETDTLIDVYNRMIESLRQERIHNREQSHFLQKILQTTHSAIITFDFDHQIEMINPAGLHFLGLTEKETLGKKLAELHSELAVELCALSLDKPTVVPFLGQRRLRCTYSSFLDRGFRKFYIFMDELTEELRKIERAAYEKVIRVMSHEINNSLGAVHSLLHSCMSFAPQIQPSDREDFEIALKVIIARTDHLKSFMQGYASVVKLPEPQRSPVQIRKLWEHVHLLMASELQRRNISWEWQVDKQKPISLDAPQMEQVFLNIAKNAVEAIGENGFITLKITHHLGKPCLILEDTGKGLSPDIERHVFTPFYTTKPDGVGIGLTLVSEILGNHGFTFSLSSSPGDQTRFTIWFH